MRFGLAVLSLIACLLGGSPAGAATELQVIRVGPLNILTFTSDAGPLRATAMEQGKVVIENAAALSSDAMARLGQLRDLVTRTRVDGSRLQLFLDPGVYSTSQPLPGGGLNLTLERSGRVSSRRTASTPAPVPVIPERPRAIPRPTPRPEAAPERTTAPPSRVPAEPAAAPPAPRVPEGVEITASPAHEGTELAFAWPEPVRVAVFQRGDTLWAAFDAKADEVRGLDRLTSTGGWIKPLPTTSADDATIFRFKLGHPASAEAAQDGRTWRVRLAPGAKTAAPALGVVRDQEAGVLRGTAPTRALALTNPDTGEQLGAIMAAGDSLRHPPATRLVDLELLPAAQGLAWAPLADAITVAADDGGFTLTRDGGLRLSASAPASANPPTLVRPHALLGLPALAGTDPAARQQARLAIAGRIAGLPPKAQALARLDQVRLLLADGLAPEARATLERRLPAELQADDRAEIERSRAAMAAAAAALEGQHGKALGELLAPELDGDPEVALWRAFAAAGAGQHDLAARAWRESGRVLADYPLPLRLTLGLKIAESLGQGGATQQARDLQDLLRPAADGPARARLDLLRGVAASRTAQPMLAEQSLRAAADAGDADTKVRADFLLALARHEQGGLDAAAASAALSSQRPAWRGHPWEVRMLRQLGILQFAAGDPIAAFATTQEAATRPGNPAEAAAAADDLRQRLKEVVRAAGDGKQPPLTAVALHRAYGYLLEGTPEAHQLRREVAKLATSAGLEESAARLASAEGLPEKADDGTAARQQLAAAVGRGDWPAVGQAARTLLGRHPAGTVLPEDDAAAVVWLALASARTGAPAEAAALPGRYQERLPEGPWQALLALVASAAPEAGRGQSAIAAADSLVRAVRQRLDELRTPGA